MLQSARAVLDSFFSSPGFASPPPVRLRDNGIRLRKQSRKSSPGGNEHGLPAGGFKGFGARPEGSRRGKGSSGRSGGRSEEWGVASTGIYRAEMQEVST
ncbi:hypothetical protein KFL_004050100 [Klebsormidium nitens]|uniref:Uncharacterized protein n=1 Tax=Klebsormidium nitens TaxID=105231 RepID=A0A1Y1IB25_KLENI|nr:hypothetical protein KFL_004050100 [Klebsormidium nitens]|eukprot:GAQ88165.1 hypothetical protein KFL_004050100 [Klebsormidium nitens]